MRTLTLLETERVKNLTRNSVSLALIQPTETALKKSIMDATGMVRSYLKNNGVHNYQSQKKGQLNKCLIDSKIITDRKKFDTKTSLYSPETKD